MKAKLIRDAGISMQARVQNFFQGNKRRFFGVVDKTPRKAKDPTSIDVLVDALLAKGERKDQEEAKQEAAVSDTFLTFVSDLQVKGKLDRIVIDECHIILTLSIAVN
ncbi:hypothetical protein H2201_008558 [Coniosporium apollinis]|uniref:SNF2 N-terminal domain-containing protein n=1 Tax=Coniosporium apollinis TaxID=61459 RepID=A0ABQ9NKZ9_9PEZI|nr:hypothetical protein H2201_008558 [Coniosporium apollinis]